MKKLICTALAFCLLLSFSACGKHQQEEPTTESTTEVTTEATTEPTTETTTEATTEATEETEEPAEVGVSGTVFNTDSLNVRKGPGTNFDTVTSLKRGSVVEVFEQSAVDGTVWGRIANGWVNMQYVSLNHVHKYTKQTTYPTCTTQGYTTYTCTCGDSYEDDFRPTTGHTWSDWVITKEPTTSAKGLSKRSCAICGTTEEKELDKLIEGHTHNYTAKVTREATCAAYGIRTYTCSCGSSYTENIERLAHTYKDTVTAPTCTSRGYTTHTCTACKSSYTDTYTAQLSHNYTTQIMQPTCTTAGYTTHTCKRCGSSYKDSQVAALGHACGDWATTKEPTTTSTGLAIRFCSRCNYSETKELPKQDSTKPTEHIHDWTLWETVAHTCTEDGYYIRYCKTCSASEKENSYDPAPGHKYTVVSSKDPTCTENGFITYQCSACGDSYTETLPAAHKWEHHHTPEVTGKSAPYLLCSCGLRFSSEAEWDVHDKEMWSQGDVTHSWSSHVDTIIIEPAKDWDECSVCGLTK